MPTPTTPIDLGEKIEDLIDPQGEIADAWQRQHELIADAAQYPDGSTQRDNVTAEAQREADRWNAWKSCADTVTALARTIREQRDALSPAPARHYRRMRRGYLAAAAYGALGTVSIAAFATPIGQWWMTLTSVAAYAATAWAIRSASQEHQNYTLADRKRTGMLLRHRRRLRSLIDAAEHGMAPSLSSYVDDAQGSPSQDHRVDVFTAPAC